MKTKSDDNFLERRLLALKYAGFNLETEKDWLHEESRSEEIVILRGVIKNKQKFNELVIQLADFAFVHIEFHGESGRYEITLLPIKIPV
jgi:hypothetical protein